MNIPPACRLFFLVICSLLSTSAWGKDTPKPILFNIARDNVGANGANSFSFDLNEWKCRVDGKGRGQCSTKNAAWNFRLPVADGSISNIFFEADGRGNMVYSVDNGEAVWATAVQVAPRRANPRWVVQLPGLNFTPPLLYRDRIIVTSAVSVGSISATTGEWIWRHQWLPISRARRTSRHDQR